MALLISEVVSEVVSEVDVGGAKFCRAVGMEGVFFAWAGIVTTSAPEKTRRGGVFCELRITSLTTT